MKNLKIYLSLCIILYGCNKEPAYDLIATEAKPYAAFAAGSYWIFQNDSTLLIDSLVSSYADYGKNDIGTNRQPHYVYTFTGAAYSKLDTTSSMIAFGYIIEGRVITYQFFQTVFRPNAFALPSGLEPVDTVLNFNYFDKMLLNGKEYEDVYQIEEEVHTNTLAGISPLIRGEIYMAKNVGLIKVVLSYNNGKSISWSLLRHKTSILYDH